MGSDDVTRASGHAGPEGAGAPEGAVDWLHQDHPALTPLLGFWCGIATVLVLPALYVMALRTLMEHESAERWFWGVLAVLLLPAGLILSGRSRRGGLYMLLGMVTTVMVVLGVGGAVLWVLTR